MWKLADNLALELLADGPVLLVLLVRLGKLKGIVLALEFKYPGTLLLYMHLQPLTFCDKVLPFLEVVVSLSRKLLVLLGNGLVGTTKLYVVVRDRAVEAGRNTFVFLVCLLVLFDNFMEGVFLFFVGPSV